jgi:hypothetical protein
MVFMINLLSSGYPRFKLGARSEGFGPAPSG